MKKQSTFALAPFFLALFLFPILLSSQASKGSYFVLQYLKVQPTQESEFYNLETSVWMKMHEARIKADLLDGYYMFRVISPMGTKTEYNYVVALEYDNSSKLAGHFESFGVDYTEILDDQEIKMALRTPEVRDLVYEEVWENLDLEMKDDASKPFRFQVFNAMKLKTGVSAEAYQKIEQQYWKPVHKSRISKDKLHGWGIYHMIIPGGTEREYQWATVDYYDRFIDIMENSDALFNQLHGAKNANKYLGETLASRDLLRMEVRELLESLIDVEEGL